MFSVGIIGCGRPWKSEGSTGFGMSRQHAQGYLASPDCKIVALADISQENAQAFQKDLGGERIYTDYRQMLATEKLDIVSISTWPELHAPMVLAAAEAGVKAIHCEKPMATTFGDARRMAEACKSRGIQLTFNHQRRFLAPFRMAKAMLKEGRIGELVRLEAATSNLYDWGTHWFDMLFFLNDESPAQWVIGQIDVRGNRKIFGAPVEGQGLAHFKFKNGVHGLMVTGFEAGWEAEIRLIGRQGVIEIAPKDGTNNDVRIWAKGQSDWEGHKLEENIHGNEAVKRGVLDLVDALKNKREPELSGRRALQATELIFATWESSRRRGRVDLPLTIDDSPLADLIAQATPS
jgi:predicted dehydrogenase